MGLSTCRRRFHSNENSVGLNGLCFGSLFAVFPKLGSFMSEAWMVYPSCHEPLANVLLPVAEMIGNAGDCIYYLGHGGDSDVR